MAIAAPIRNLDVGWLFPGGNRLKNKVSCVEFLMIVLCIPSVAVSVCGASLAVLMYSVFLYHH